MKLSARFKWKEAKSTVSSIKDEIRECQVKLQTSPIVDIKQDTNSIRSVTSTLLGTDSKLSVEVKARERRAILDWFFAGIAGERHQEVVDRREKNTGAWFFEMDSFKKWANREVSWLNCEGNRMYLHP
ncbi:hypothetical protein P167DRAFT_400873 [Morchella conica CCBAS932]|uniref:Uncharacterized protein n=1 Tax=Morchella conica CCBAS932 TaxID=1392247 RepID=A0A3N4KDU9_9PEZI|nr:hypothetical protein P167DRAFT_400873 [Morchella conica CCBAS932]